MHLLRKLIYIAGLAALLVSQPGYAMGLGESELKSALNQPLQADIELTNLRGLDENEIIVRLASNEDFERAGLERLEYYSQLQFEVMLDHDSGPIVRVTTREPVREPYLNILVEARWASGRLLREYTFLLDLPTYDDDRSTQPVEAARADSGRDTASGSRRESPQQRASRDRASDTETRRGSAGEGSDTYGPVGGNDTLWEIALQVRPGRDVSVQQTMLAIQRKNPEAFINGNINLLREGQVLRLPNRDEIQGQSQQQAVREVADHNRQWSERNSDRAMGAQLDAGQRGSSAPRDAEEVSGQVRLATPNQSGSDDAGQGGGDSTDRGAELESELASAQEELERTQRENTELSSRVEELEEQIETMESLIEASNEQLTALQTAAQQSQEEAQQPETAEETGAEATEQADAEAQDESAEAQTAAEEAPAEEAATETAETTEEASADEDRNRRVVRSIPQSKTLVDHLLDNILWIALAVLIILAGVYYMLRRRGEAEAAEPEENTFDSDFEAENFADSQEDFQTVDDDVDGVDLSREADEEFDSADWADDEEPGLEAETGDVVGEADIYIAYGKLDQAEELLLNGLEKEPGSPQILSKLLEVNAENRDVEAFDKHYARLLATDDRAAIQRAGELRDTIPGAGEFDVSALDSGAPNESSESEGRAEPSMDFSDLDDNASDDLDFSLDLDDELEGSDSVGAEGDSAKRELDSGSSDDEEFSLDDDFTFDLEDDEEPEAAEKPLVGDEDLEGSSSSSRYDLTFGEADEEKASESDSEFTLDFDLEDEDSSAETPESQTKGTDEEFPELDLNLDSDDELSGAATDEKADDDWSFDFETSDSETADLDKLDEELSALDEEPSAGHEPSADKEPSAGEEPHNETTTSDQDDDFSFDLEDSLGETASPESDSETDKQDFAPELDEDFSLDFDEEPSADIEPSADEEPSADREPSAAGQEPSADKDPSADQAPAADEKTTADSDAEADFDLDDMDMDDMDLSRLDQDMSELDADLDEPASESASSEEEPPSPAADERAGGEVSEGDSDGDDMFDEALSGFSEETAESEPTDSSEAGSSEAGEERSEEDMDSELDFLADTDEAATKLDLARAYIDMGDADGARDILEEVSQEGNDEQKQEAAELLSRIEA